MTAATRPVPAAANAGLGWMRRHPVAAFLLVCFGLTWAGWGPGLAAFGVYDLTNLATLRGYTVLMTVVDMVWGTFATALGGGVAYRLIMASR